ncbi:peptidoglycan DD-metalloendopeptidase family protein [Lysobacter humi (ex Lee et al. 2017)]
MPLRPSIAVAAVLVLAGCSSAVVRTPSPSASRAPVVQPATGKPGATVTVQRGDTLFSIASRNGIALQDLARWNGIAEPYTIYPGQRLRLYPGRGGVGTPSAPRRDARSSRPAAGTARPPATGTAAPRPATPAPVPPPPSSGFAWRWPADGALVGRFIGGDPTKQGIDIAGAAGASVRAAADGTVVYSGAGLVGYGELVIIKHAGNWLSAYGHNRRRLVNEGQLVKAGDQIAEMGRSGAPRDMLHFEIRYNGRPIDPMLYLPPR